jgi:quinoprotein glucose dehydrogenase
MPGNNGGANWGGAAVDPSDGTLYVGSKDLPCLLKLAPAPESGPDRYTSGFGFMLTSSGLSPIAPPWSSLTAYDLNAGTIKWQIPIGEVPALAAKGIKNTGSHRPKLGPVVTAGGLIFIGTEDRKVRALDKETGKVLWEKELAAALEGIPAVYQIGGREYLVVCAAGQAGANGAYVAFALPGRAVGNIGFETRGKNE